MSIDGYMSILSMVHVHVCVTCYKPQVSAVAETLSLTDTSLGVRSRGDSLSLTDTSDSPLQTPPLVSAVAETLPTVC